MDDVTRKTIKTIETIETIKHNETIEKREIVKEQQFYLSLLAKDDHPGDMLNMLNKDPVKHAFAISFNETNNKTMAAITMDLLHKNESGLVQEGELGALHRETGHVHDANFYINLLHRNSTKVQKPGERAQVKSSYRNNERAAVLGVHWELGQIVIDMVAGWLVTL